MRLGVKSAVPARECVGVPSTGRRLAPRRLHGVRTNAAPPPRQRRLAPWARPPTAEGVVVDPLVHSAAPHHAATPHIPTVSASSLVTDPISFGSCRLPLHLHSLRWRPRPPSLPSPLPPPASVAPLLQLTVVLVRMPLTVVVPVGAVSIARDTHPPSPVGHVVR
jgi:hypothetical protein